MRVFISHSYEDKRWAYQIAAKLKQAGLYVWNPEAELFPGDNWHLEIGKALAAAEAMIVLDVARGGRTRKCYERKSRTRSVRKNSRTDSFR